MIRLQKDTAKALLSLHGWLGVTLGLLLYAVILTGTLAVFAKELGAWANPLPEARQSYYPAGTGALLEDLAQRIDPSYLEEVFLFPADDGRVRALFHTHGKNDAGEVEERGVLALIDPTVPAIVEEREGEVGALFRDVQNSALTDFLVELHVRLLLPGQWGLLLTGILGFAMLAAAVTGFVLHRHLIKELFTLRRREGSLLTARDTHVLAGAWNLPFAFILAFTGAFFSFGGAIGLPAIAYVAFGGDVDSISEELLSPTVPGSVEESVPLQNLDILIADARRRSGAEPQNMQILHWGRGNASVQMGMATAEGRLLPDTVLYQGASGEFLGVKPALGQEPSLGGDLAGLMTPLHFGNFAGLYSKIVWFAFGFASAYVTFTGLRLWTTRRREESGWAWLERATLLVGFGLPVSLVVVAYAFLLKVSGAGLLPVFFASATVVGLLVFRGLGVGAIKMILGGGILLLPLVRLISGGPAWWELQGQLGVAAMDCALILAGVLCLRQAKTGAGDKADASAVLAESV